nr:hypothetical protein Iba_chr14eCG5410 [Ipomoea batatas]
MIVDGEATKIDTFTPPSSAVRTIATAHCREGRSAAHTHCLLPEQGAHGWVTVPPSPPAATVRHREGKPDRSASSICCPLQARSFCSRRRQTRRRRTAATFALLQSAEREEYGSFGSPSELPTAAIRRRSSPASLWHMPLTIGASLSVAQAIFHVRKMTLFFMVSVDHIFWRLPNTKIWKMISGNHFPGYQTHPKLVFKEIGLYIFKIPRYLISQLIKFKYFIK